MRAYFILFLVLAAEAFSQSSAPPKTVAVNLERARTLLDASLKDKNPDTRKQAVQALGLVGINGTYPSELESMLDDKDMEVRLAAITSLVDLSNKRTVPVLKKALNGDVPEVSFAAAKALWTLNDPAGRQALVSVLSGETKTSSGFVTKQKRDALRMLQTPKTMFLFALKQGVNLAPVPGLGAGVSSVQGILSDAGISGRAATALLLSADKSPEVHAALREALSDSDASVRAAAVHAIALRSDPTMKEELVPLFDDKKEAVRVRAAAGYIRLDSMRGTRRPASPVTPGKK